MKLNIFLSIAGQEAFAKGDTIQYWNFEIRPAEGEDWQTAAPKGGKLVASNVEVTLPNKLGCIAAAVTDLREEQSRIYAEATKEAAALKERESDLLALSYTPSQPEVL